MTLVPAMRKSATVFKAAHRCHGVLVRITCESVGQYAWHSIQVSDKSEQDAFRKKYPI